MISVRHFNPYLSTLDYISDRLTLFLLLARADTARKIYTNITLEKLSLLRHLHLREERWEDGMGAWAGIVKVCCISSCLLLSMISCVFLWDPLVVYSKRHCAGEKQSK